MPLINSLKAIELLRDHFTPSLWKWAVLKSLSFRILITPVFIDNGILFFSINEEWQNNENKFKHYEWPALQPNHFSEHPSLSAQIRLKLLGNKRITDSHIAELKIFLFEQYHLLAMRVSNIVRLRITHRPKQFQLDATQATMFRYLFIGRGKFN